MENIVMEDFIDRYECLYFDLDSCPEDYILKHYKSKEVSKENYTSILNERLNIGSLNAANYKAEKKIMENLENSKFDKFALAWKAGKVDWKDNQLITTDGFEKDNCYINGYGAKIDKGEFMTYCENLEEVKSKIIQAVENGNWKEAYINVVKDSPKNIGPVYNINTLFFLTSGKAPIYDAFVHKAAKALLLDIKPCEVYLGGNPDKNDFDNVVAMYQEYMILLKMLFKDWFKNKQENGMFIPRELDRALWVYGHSKKEIYKN